MSNNRARVAAWLDELPQIRAPVAEKALASAASDGPSDRKACAQKDAENAKLVERHVDQNPGQGKDTLYFEYRQLRLDDHRLPEPLFGFLSELVDDLKRRDEILPKSQKDLILFFFDASADREELDDDRLYFDDGVDKDDKDKWPNPSLIAFWYSRANELDPSSTEKTWCTEGDSTRGPIIPSFLHDALSHRHEMYDKTGKIQLSFHDIGNSPIYIASRIPGCRPNVKNNYAMVLDPQQKIAGGATSFVDINAIKCNSTHRRPIAYCITVSRDLEAAKLQLGAWMAAHWRKLDSLRDSRAIPMPDYLVGIAIQDTDWHLVVSSLETRKVVIWSQLTFGTMSSVLGMYSIVRTLRFLDEQFVRREYWPWIRDQVLLQPEESCD